MDPKKATGPVTVQSSEFFMNTTGKVPGDMQALEGAAGLWERPRLAWTVAGVVAGLGVVGVIAMAVHGSSVADALRKSQNELAGVTNTAMTQADRITAFESGQTQQANEVLAKGQADATAQKVAKDLASKIAAEVQEQVDAGDLTITPDGKRVRIELHDSLLFDGPKMELSDAARDAVRKIAGVIKKSEGAVEVVGHIDPRHARAAAEVSDGSWGLSAERAALVVRAFEDARISSKRLALTAKGSTAPLGSNGSSKGREKNRRVEVFITP